MAISKKDSKTLIKLCEKINEEYGKGTVIASEADYENVEPIHSGSIALDLSLGIGGYAKGRIIEIFGNNSLGKTTVALESIRAVQEKGGSAVLVDMEHAIDPELMVSMGIKIEAPDLIWAQPENGEEAINIAREYAESGLVDLIVVDSVPALITSAEVKDEAGDKKMGSLAKLMHKTLRVLSPIVSKNKTTLLFINQVYDKIGAYGGTTTMGGRGLGFFSTMRIELSRPPKVEMKKAFGTEDNRIIINGEQVGHYTKYTIVKNKVARPYRKGIFPIRWGVGIDKVAEALMIATRIGIIEKGKGSRFYYVQDAENKQLLGHGLENTIEALRTNTEALKVIQEEIKLEAKRIKESRYNNG